MTEIFKMLTCHQFYLTNHYYRQTSNIRLNLVGNTIVDHSDVVLHLHSRFNTWLQWTGQRPLQDETRNIQVWEFGAPCIGGLTVHKLLRCIIKGCSVGWQNMKSIKLSHLLIIWGQCSYIPQSTGATQIYKLVYTANIITWMVLHSYILFLSYAQ